MSNTGLSSAMKMDLHCHSYFSDGNHSPDYLLERAQQNQITHLAITDHDCIEACSFSSSQYPEVTLINGVEISSAWNNLEVHVLGLCIDSANVQLQQLLARQQTQRQLRIQEMDVKLNNLGTAGLMAHLDNLPCIAYTRSHAADFLVLKGVCKNRQKAFKSHLGKNGRIYVAPKWCDLQDAVAGIRSAGGIAVLAHPGRYPLSRRKLEALTDDFCAAGGEALEVSYANIQPDIKQRLSELAISRQMYCSIGSDFHDAQASWTDLGKFPQLDAEAKKNAIWLHPKWHS